MRIVFMGTPEFAVPCLETLHRSDHEVVAVITAPDKPQGRGLALESSPVKQCAVHLGIPVMQPPVLKDPEFLNNLSRLQADAFVVVAFRMLPEVVWSMPPRGTYNLHASLLPQYRGAAPINWAIINGETETGLTTFRIRQEIDTGNLAFQETEPILPDDTAGSLYERLRQKGAGLMLKTMDALANGRLPDIPQPTDTSGLKPAPKIFRETCRIDWSKSASDIRNFIRGLSPYPGAWTTMDGKTIKIHGASATEHAATLPFGHGSASPSGGLLVGCGNDTTLELMEVQPEGKKKMSGQDFLRGLRQTTTVFT